MHDAAYKLLFSRPRMVRDLLDGFAARGWSDALDFDTLTPLPASFVGEDLRQRHADLVWRVRFRDEDWLYLVLLLEFQATVDPAMAVRMLAYTAMVLQRLVADGVLSEHGALPSILPVVLYNGPRRWTAPLEVADMFAAAAPHRPSQRYYVLDVRRAPGADLPADNLVSALVGLESARDASGLDAALRALGELVRAAGDEHLRRAFGAWLRARLGASGRLPAGAEDPLARLEETQTMLEETLGEWTREWLERGRDEGRAEGIEQGRDEGRAEGIEQGRDEGRAEERALLCRQAARKFDGAAAEGLAAALAGVTDPERLGRVGEWIIECATAEDLLARVRRDHGSGG